MYSDKYLKYKKKYLNKKNNLKGGTHSIIKDRFLKQKTSHNTNTLFFNSTHDNIPNINYYIVTNTTFSGRMSGDDILNNIYLLDPRRSKILGESTHDQLKCINIYFYSKINNFIFNDINDIKQDEIALINSTCSKPNFDLLNGILFKTNGILFKTNNTILSLNNYIEYFKNIENKNSILEKNTLIDTNIFNIYNGTIYEPLINKFKYGFKYAFFYGEDGFKNNIEQLIINTQSLNNKKIISKNGFSNSISEVDEFITTNLNERIKICQEQIQINIIEYDETYNILIDKSKIDIENTTFDTDDLLHIDIMIINVIYIVYYIYCIDIYKYIVNDLKNIIKSETIQKTELLINSLKSELCKIDDETSNKDLFFNIDTSILQFYNNFNMKINSIHPYFINFDIKCFKYNTFIEFNNFI